MRAINRCPQHPHHADNTAPVKKPKKHQPPKDEAPQPVAQDARKDRDGDG